LISRLFDVIFILIFMLFLPETLTLQIRFFFQSKYHKASYLCFGLKLICIIEDL
jgi:hypothetical protein